MGVKVGSSNSAFERFAIFAVGNDISRECAFKAWCADKGWPITAVFGSYKGKVERAFYVPASGLSAMAQWYEGQESILLLGPLYREGKMHGNREAVLHMLKTEEHIPLGTFDWSTREYALAQEAWTYDPNESAYFVCIKH